MKKSFSYILSLALVVILGSKTCSAMEQKKNLEDQDKQIEVYKGDTHIYDLPDDCLMHALIFLSFEDYKKIFSTCKNFKDAILTIIEKFFVGSRDPQKINQFFSELRPEFGNQMPPVSFQRNWLDGTYDHKKVTLPQMPSDLSVAIPNDPTLRSFVISLDKKKTIKMTLVLTDNQNQLVIRSISKEISSPIGHIIYLITNSSDSKLINNLFDIMEELLKQHSEAWEKANPTDCQALFIDQYDSGDYSKLQANPFDAIIKNGTLIKCFNLAFEHKKENLVDLIIEITESKRCANPSAFSFGLLRDALNQENFDLARLLCQKFEPIMNMNRWKIARLFKSAIANCAEETILFILDHMKTKLEFHKDHLVMFYKDRFNENLYAPMVNLLLQKLPPNDQNTKNLYKQMLLSAKHCQFKHIEALITQALSPKIETENK